MTEEKTAPEGKPAEEAAAAPAAEGTEGPEDAAGSAGPDADAGPDAMTEAELRAQIEEHFRSQPLAEVLKQFLISLSTLAYVKMGITEDTVKYRDLAQAGLAIDAFKGVLDAVSARLGSQDASALAGALASMQMTFARASAEPASEEGGPEKKDDPADRLWVPGKD